MANTPDIVAPVADTNRRKKPAQVRTSQPSSNEKSTEHEDLWITLHVADEALSTYQILLNQQIAGGKSCQLLMSGKEMALPE